MLHLIKSINHKYHLIAWIVLGLVVLMETLCFTGLYFIYVGLIPMPTLLLIIGAHLMASFLYFLVPYLVRPSDSHHDRSSSIRYFASIGSIICLFFPLIGSIGILIIFASMNTWLKPKGIVNGIGLENSDAQNDYNRDSQISVSIFSRIKSDINALIAEETNTEPVIDILHSNNENYKRGAVTFLGRLGTPEAVRLLERYLMDNNPEIRSYAHTMLTRIDESFINRIKTVLKRVKTGGILKRDDEKELSQLYLQYAESGLLDAATRNHYLRLAQETYQKAFENEPENIEGIFNQAYLSMLSRDYKKAVQFYQQAIKENYNISESLLFLCQIYYEMHDFPALINFIKKLKECGCKSENVNFNLAFKFWTCQ